LSRKNARILDCQWFRVLQQKVVAFASGLQAWLGEEEEEEEEICMLDIRMSRTPIEGSPVCLTYRVKHRVFDARASPHFDVVEVGCGVLRVVNQ
jgi:hypothetical protein